MKKRIYDEDCDMDAIYESNETHVKENLEKDGFSGYFKTIFTKSSLENNGFGFNRSKHYQQILNEEKTITEIDDMFSEGDLAFFKHFVKSENRIPTKFKEDKKFLKVMDI